MLQLKCAINLLSAYFSLYEILAYMKSKIQGLKIEKLCETILLSLGWLIVFKINTFWFDLGRLHIIVGLCICLGYMLTKDGPFSNFSHDDDNIFAGWSMVILKPIC